VWALSSKAGFIRTKKSSRDNDPRGMQVDQKAAILDASPLCALALGSDGKALAANAAFVDLMGPLFKFSGYEFAESAATEDGKTKLKVAIASVRAGIAPRERLRNLEMLTLAGEAGLPIKSHFDWFIGPGSAAGEIILFGDPCSDDLLEQREKDAELIDFFQNAPIALHWLSGTGHVMWANQTELDVLGYTAKEYIGQPIMKFCPDEEELVLEIFKTLGSGNIIKDVPVRFRTKAGKIVPLLIDSNVAYKVDELGEKAFNHTRCFIRDDTGRRVREARVEALLNETQRSLKLLDAFVSRTLHLVRTPCHVVQTSLGLLMSNLQQLERRLPSDEQPFLSETRGLLEASATQLTEVSELISDASDVMRFDQGAVLQTVPVVLPLSALGRACVDEAKTLAKRGVEVVFELAAGPSVVSIDAKVLHRAVRHLLRNAAQATPAGGRIVLRVNHVDQAASWTGHAGGTRLRFEVSDTGSGIPSEAPNVFQRFYPGPVPKPTAEGAPQDVTEEKIVEAREKLESSLSFSSSKTSGLGIGLNLTYSLVRALGGELRCESSYGDTRFWFTVPVTDAQTHAAASSYLAGGPVSPEAAPLKYNWDSITGTGSSTSSDPDVKSSSSSSDSESSLRRFIDVPTRKKSVAASCVANQGLKAIDPPHVLVVEDTEMCAVVVRMLLSKLGCSSEHAIHGKEAVRMLEQAEPGLYSLVLMDLRMPVMDGFEATRIIKQELKLDVPVVALTADESFDIRDKCITAGCSDFTHKPLKYDVLSSMLEKFTGHVVDDDSE